MRPTFVALRATPLVWLLGGALMPSAAGAASPEPPALQPSAEQAPAFMLATPWPTDADPAGFLVSEKYDGVRALWDGQTLRFRSGRPIAAPAWFLAALPATALDGELWLARGHFDQLSATVRRSTPLEAEWRRLNYLVFDLPGAAGTFAERNARLQALLGAVGVPWLRPVAQAPVADRVALQDQLQQLVAAGGEGLVLHRADALWQPGRAAVVHKLKPQPDAEARVVAHLPGRGRHAGRLGALLLEMPNGQRFALGTGLSDAQRAAPPPLDAWVTYRYRALTRSGRPRFASFLRLRDAE